MKVVLPKHGPFVIMTNGFNDEETVLNIFSDLKFVNNVRVFCFDEFNSSEFLKFNERHVSKITNLYRLVSNTFFSCYNILYIRDLKSLFSDTNLKINFKETSVNLDVKEDILSLSQEEKEKVLSLLREIDNSNSKIKKFSSNKFNDIYETVEFNVFPIYFNYDTKYELFYFAKSPRFENILIFTGLEKVRDDISNKIVRSIIKTLIGKVEEISGAIDKVSVNFTFFPVIQEKPYENDLVEKITIGAELEFELISKDNFKLIHTGNLIANNIELLYENYYEEYDEDLNIIDYLLKSQIGVDGNTETGEIRSNSYSIKDIKSFKSNIKNIIEEVLSFINKRSIKRRYNNPVLSFGSYYIPLGFHIHFGFNGDRFKSKIFNYNKNNLVKVFDLIAGILFQDANCRGRVNRAYAQLSNTESKKYGFEYRTLPASLVYYNLHEDIIELFVKVVKDLNEKKYVVIPFDKNGHVKKEFYENNIENGKTFLKRVEKLIKDTYLNLCYFEEDLQEIKRKELGKIGFEYFNEVFELFNSINKYTKNCCILPYGLRSSRGKFANTVIGTEYYQDLNQELAFPFVERTANIFSKQIYHIPVGISYHLRQENFENPSDEESIEVLKDMVEKLLKHLEDKGLLKQKSDKVLENLKKEFAFFGNLYYKEKVKVEI